MAPVRVVPASQPGEDRHIRFGLAPEASPVEPMEGTRAPRGNLAERVAGVLATARERMRLVIAIGNCRTLFKQSGVVRYPGTFTLMKCFPSSRFSNVNVSSRSGCVVRKKRDSQVRPRHLQLAVITPDCKIAEGMS